MGYIDNNLMVGEQIIYYTKKHWIVFFLPSILAIIGFIILLFVISDKSLIMLIGFAIACLGTAIIIGLSTFISYKTSEFGITNKRVLIKVGFVRRDSLEIFLTKIEGIQVSQDILGRILDYGTIIVKGTGGTGNPFHTIEAPLEFRKKVQEQIASIQ